MSTHGSANELHFSAERLRRQIRLILQGWGMSTERARLTARLMVETDLLGVESHGISMLPQYELLLQRGGLRIDAEPQQVKETGATALWDGGAGLGHAVSHAAIHQAIHTARRFGVALGGVFNSHHFGAAGVYVREATQQGLIALVTSSAQGILVVPTRARVPVLGTNPIAFGAPAGSERAPVILDMATSTTAANKIKLMAMRDQTLPDGWVVDGQGHGVTHAGTARRLLTERTGGGLTPLGGSPDLASHKGYGLGLMAQILSANLNGASFAAAENAQTKNGRPDNVGHSFLVIDPAFFAGGEAFAAGMANMVDFLHHTPALRPEEPVLVPGDPELAAYGRRQQQGVPLPDILRAQVAEIAGRAGVAFLLDSADAPGAEA